MIFIVMIVLILIDEIKIQKSSSIWSAALEERPATCKNQQLSRKDMAYFDYNHNKFKYYQHINNA